MVDGAGIKIDEDMLLGVKTPKKHKNLTGGLVRNESW